MESPRTDTLRLMENVVAAALLCVSATVFGVLSFAASLRPYLEFPPRSVHIEHAPFSLSIFLIYGALVAAFICFAVYLNRGFKVTLRLQFKGRFPWWGYLALLMVLLAWVCAWNRFATLTSIQQHTFIPLWYAFIVLLNAVQTKLTGSCALTARPRYFLLLFPLSSIFWWFFELLNRAVQNWHYLGTQYFSDVGYVVFATISFATVLPAVETVFLILDAVAAKEAFSRHLPVAALNSRLVLWAILTVSLFGLFLLSMSPNVLFSLLWLCPTLVLLSLQKLHGGSSLAEEMSQGRWREPMLWASSALLCGVFWEMWNYWSLAKWVYLVPYVQAFHIFEMPLLGYAGYLPFGVFCGAVIREVRRLEEDSGNRF